MATVPAAMLRSRLADTPARQRLVSGLPATCWPGAAASYAELIASGAVQVDAVSYPLDDVATAWADTSTEHRAVARSESHRHPGSSHRGSSQAR